MRRTTTLSLSPASRSRPVIAKPVVANLNSEESERLIRAGVQQLRAGNYENALEQFQAVLAHRQAGC